MVNWKKAGGILITLGVTATVCYVGYSFVFKANKNDFASFEESIKDSEWSKGWDEKLKAIALKKIHNLSKKELKQFSDLVNKYPDFSDSERKTFDSIITKWNFDTKSTKNI